jgi:hypothetical protein
MATLRPFALIPPLCDFRERKGNMLNQASTKMSNFE